MKQFFLIDDDFESIIKSQINTQINKIEVISTGWTNIVYRVESETGNYYFRFPRDEFWEKTIVKDYEFAKFIKGKTSFETVDLKLCYNDGRAFSMHKEIPGYCLADKVNEMSEEDVKRVSNQIAKFMYELHNIKFNENEIFTISSNIGLNLNDFVDELLNKHVYEEDRKFWSKNNFKIADFEQKCLVHGDLNSSNIIVDENNNVKAIIDFGFGGYGNKYFDISRIIGRCPERFKQPIIEGYEELEKIALAYNKLEQNISIWTNIDNGYINYMRGIGIYN